MHHKLLSVHQVCAGGNNNQRQVGVFTDEGCRFFPLDTCWDALKLLSNISVMLEYTTRIQNIIQLIYLD